MPANSLLQQAQERRFPPLAASPILSELHNTSAQPMLVKLPARMPAHTAHRKRRPKVTASKKCGSEPHSRARNSGRMRVLGHETFCTTTSPTSPKNLSAGFLQCRLRRGDDARRSCPAAKLGSYLALNYDNDHEYGYYYYCYYYYYYY